MTNLLDLVLAHFSLGFTFVTITFLVLVSTFDKKVFHQHSTFCLLTCLLGNIYLFASIWFITFAIPFSAPVLVSVIAFYSNFNFTFMEVFYA